MPQRDANVRIGPLGHARILNRYFRRSLVDSDAEGEEAVAPVCGCSDGADRANGSSTDMTRSEGNVTITSVPTRSFELIVNVPPCRSMRFLTIGRPSPAPCSADLMALDPCPKESRTIGISSSGMPGPLSLTLMY